MADYQENVSSCLPFYGLTDREFNAMVGNWPDRRHDLDLYDLFPNPNKFDECDPDLMLNTPFSEYYSVRGFNKMLDNLDVKSFSILHCNIRSLSKNLNLLEELLYSLDSKLDILGITETKLGEKSISNVNIRGYNFFHTDSPTNAGGAALYIANDLKAVPRPDIKFDLALVESCWAEIDTGEGKKKMIIGCIYKHPTCNLEQFRNQLNDIIKTINPNRHEICIFGDININFLKFSEHTQTEEFLDMLYANNILPIITKPTRLTDHTATLIDHIYTNCLQNFTAGILTVDITDHLPIFCIVRTQPIRNNSNKKSFRDYSKFYKDLYLDDIKLINWHEILNPGKNLNEKVQEAMNTLNKIVDKHAPVKLASQSKQRQLNKPWLTKGILKSVKRKQKMYRTHFLSKDLQKIGEYKHYAAILSHLKHKRARIMFLLPRKNS